MSSSRASLSDISQCADAATIVDQNKSSTCQADESEPFSMAYIGSSRVAGNYLLDTLTIGDCEIANFSFAAATVASASIQHFGSTTGVLGINAAVGKAECLHGGCTKAVKPTISEAMASAGCIGSSSYSLSLDDDNGRSPSILFGGIDTAKFTGPLVTLHTKPHENASLPDRHQKQVLRLAEMTTRLNSTPRRTYKPENGRDAVDIDTGSKGIILPDDWVSSIFSGLQQMSAGRRQKDYPAEMVISCDAIDANVSLDFTLADETERSVQVGIPLRELVVPLGFL